VTANQSFLAVEVYRGGTTYYVQIIEQDGANNYYTGWTSFSLNTTYYLQIVRDENNGTYGTLYCNIYSDAARMVRLASIQLTLHTSKKDFRYLFTAQNYNDSSGSNISGYTENLYISSASRDLAYKIRDRVSGTWGNVGTVTSDILYDPNDYGSSYFTSCADVGHTEIVYIFYYNGTTPSNGNIVYRTWDGSSISSATTFVSAPSLKSGNFTAPLFDSDKIPVLYHLASNSIMLEKLDLTKTQFSSDGMLVSLTGDNSQGTWIEDKVVTAYPKTLVTYIDRSHKLYGRIYNHDTSSWEGSWTNMTSKRYWDLHNVLTISIDPNKFIYAYEGGREHGSNPAPNYLIAYKSKYTLDDVNFSLNTQDTNKWDNISPTNLAGRGYKRIIVDNYGIPHLLFWWETTLSIREYRNSVWSSATNLVFTTYPPAYPYWLNACLGMETTGQKSIHLCWSYRQITYQPEVTKGNILQWELNYMQIIPNGAGGYTAKTSTGGSLSLPCTETNKDNIYSGSTIMSQRANSTAYSVGNTVTLVTNNGHWYECTTAGTSASGPPTFNTNHYSTTTDGSVVWTEQGLWYSADWGRVFGGIILIDAATPCAVQYRCDNTSPYNMKGLYFYKWNGTNWTSTAIDTSATFPWDEIPTMVIGQNGIFVSGSKMYSGIQEIVTYTSTDNGATWSVPSRKTNSSNDNYLPLLTKRTGSLQNLISTQIIHRSYSEVILNTLSIGIIPFPFLWWERQRKRIRDAIRR
jgi:hypothetical protein